jgi:uncharacterized membrane protein
MTLDAAYASPPPPAADDSLDKGLSVVSYVILLLSPFIAGFPSVISLIIAAIRMPSASPKMRSHYRFQFKIFWVGVVLLAIGFTCGALAFASGFGLALSAWGDLSATAAGLGAGAVMLGIIAVGAFIANFVWMIVASIFGLARLADNRAVGYVAPAAGVPTVG